MTRMMTAMKKANQETKSSEMREELEGLRVRVAPGSRTCSRGNKRGSLCGKSNADAMFVSSVRVHISG